MTDATPTAMFCDECGSRVQEFHGRIDDVILANCGHPVTKRMLRELISDEVAAHAAQAVADMKERCLLYNEAVTILLECDHGDEATCGCRDRAMGRLIEIRAGQPGPKP